MAGITLAGLASGLDMESVIEQLLALQNRQVSQLNVRKATRTTQLSAWTGLQTAVYGVKSAAQTLGSASVWQDSAADSSDTDVLTATGGTGATPGVYSVTVTALAQAHQIASQGYADSTARTGTGTLEIAVGSSSYLVNISSGQDSLSGVRDAINAAGIGVRATIINTGSGAVPYRLLLTSEQTGGSHALQVTSHLTGGTAPDFANMVGAAVTGTWSGSSAPTSGGSYTGLANKTFDFTVTTGGLVGSDTVRLAWDDGQGGAGTIELASSYTPGTAVTVAEGVTVSFSAGSLVTGDDFGIAAVTPTIQAARDAEISLGSAAGGGTPLTVSRESNVIDDLIPGITLTLKQAATSPVEITVTRDTAGVRDAIVSFVDSYNGLVNLIYTQTRYDNESKVAGPLLGDAGLMALQSGVRGLVTGTVPGLAGTLRNLSALGITSSSNGQLTINSARLNDRLDGDYASLEAFFRLMGTGSDADIVFLSATDDTAASSEGYAVAITRAATQATYVGASIGAPSELAPLVIDETNDGIMASVDGVLSSTIHLAHGSYTSGASLAAALEDGINADSQLGEAEVAVAWVPDGDTQGHLEIHSARYGSASSIWWRGAEHAASGALGLLAGGSAYGQDVEGTLGGEPATGVGRVLTGNESNEHTAGLSVSVNLTPAQLLAQGGAQGILTITRGLADLVKAWAADVTDSADGLVARRQQAIQKQIDQIDKQVERLQDRVEAKRQRLVATFIQLESVLAQLQSESSYLTNALSSLSQQR